MNSELNLTVPVATNKKDTGLSKIFSLMIIFLLIILISITVMTYLKMNNIKATYAGTLLSKENIKELALKLEKQGFPERAILRWKKYLNFNNLNNNDAAKIWYRIGKLYEQKNQYTKAIESYYVSESFAKIPEIEQEISRRIEECLEPLGKFSVLKSELDARVGINQLDETSKNTKDNEIIAEIGSQKITREKLNQKIEAIIDQQLLTVKNYLSPKEINKQKEIMLNQFSSKQQKINMLNQIIIEEILYRRAREDKLIDNPEIHSLLKSQEKSFLARKVIEREITNKINITESDLKNYYKSHKENYMIPEKVKISYVLVKDENEAKEIREKLETENNFEKLKNIITKPKWLTNKDSFFSTIKEPSNAKEIIFSAKKNEIIKENIISKQGIYIIRIDDHQNKIKKDFKEVSTNVYQLLQNEKEREISTQFLNRLKDKYDVIIHHSQFKEKSDKKDKKK